MSKKIIINITKEESRVAVLQNDSVTELYTDRAREKGIIGNIYKGKVIRVLPGMQAAFVDIGLEKAAFLYVADIYKNNLQDGSDTDDAEEETPDIEEEEVIEDENESTSFTKYRVRKPYKPISELIHTNEEIIVQVSKEPLGTKGPRVTTYLSLPGRYLVYMPTAKHVGISRRIENEDERNRLKEIVSSIKKSKGGYIVRTVSEGMSKEDFDADIKFFNVIWEDIKKKAETATSPSLINNDLDLVTRIIRDIFTEKISELIIDSESEYNKILNFVGNFMPEFKQRIRLYKGPEPIFESYGIEMEITKALGRKVWLKSGGYIIIDYTEALTVIDVNTGRYVGKKNLEETILNTNMEAAKEIAYQLKLRNIGGIIIIDFIDMESEKNRDKVFNALKDTLAEDKAKNNILRISELGLVEMSRERARSDITRTLCEPCPYCEGKAYLKSPATICYEIFRELRQGFWMVKGEEMTIEAHPAVAELLYNEEQETLAELDILKDKELNIKENPSFHIEQFEIF